MGEGVSVTDAARALEVDPSTVRAWIARGAPTVVLGQAGRGRGSRVDVGALRRWRTGYAGVDVRTDAEILQKLASALLDVYKRNATDVDMRAHLALGFSDWAAATYLTEVFERCALNWTGRVPDPLPADIRILVSLAEQSKPREK